MFHLLQSVNRLRYVVTEKAMAPMIGRLSPMSDAQPASAASYHNRARFKGDPTGLEPRIAGSRGRRLIHWAKTAGAA